MSNCEKNNGVCYIAMTFDPLGEMGLDLYEAVLALRIKTLYKTLISNQIRKRCARIFNVDWCYIFNAIRLPQL